MRKRTPHEVLIVKRPSTVRITARNNTGAAIGGMSFYNDDLTSDPIASDVAIGYGPQMSALLEEWRTVLCKEAATMDNNFEEKLCVVML